ncbi:aminotransferase class V-fold PLP-dependent enzyme [Aestuariibacter sp. A3R04]|uniref:aminotransferase class V-fold PLP-dependent enzyme n=1 Tax=Aestuariibacter sp. A3R04 TaxID=2841571 RepID=UPI001C0985D8|nr:aminotransferase class V-fold PLP-dependent enzyme [Aestuariibacter sp. A3R04]MBU3020348.1 aminotransferase class V-fold PLP-dependent enzyme [Aestuariibacter sp. A3R04]
MTRFSRRQFLATTLASTSLATAMPFSTMADVKFPAPHSEAPRDIASNEAFWAKVASYYEVKRDIVNVENGNWGIMASPVMQSYFSHTARVNQDNSYYSRRKYWSELKPILHSVAARLAVSPEEICFTRGATEALQNLIANYRLLKPGDAVMYADVDYDAMQAAMDAKARTAGAKAVKFALPPVTNSDDIVAYYSHMLTQNPACKLLLLTHLSHRNGLVIPVAAIAKIAKSKGVDVIVDAAHSWGQINLTASDLEADFIGFNMHKWYGAPIGVGVMYVNRTRLHDIAPNMSASPEQSDSIWGRVHSGTSNFAAFLTVPEVLRFHDWIGADAKEVRLKYLRNLWVNAISHISAIDILTPNDPQCYGGITAFRLHNKTSSEDNRRIVSYLLENHGIFTVHRDGLASGSCVRITPSYYNSDKDMLTVAKALEEAARAFRL